MPEISRFFGMVVYMYFKDHLPPHFHVIFGDEEIKVNIDTGEILSGTLPGRQEKILLAWVEIHKDELKYNYEQMQTDNPIIKKIDPIL